MSTKKMAFKEIQRFNQWWLWLIILGTSGIVIVQACFVLIQSPPFGDEPIAKIAVLITAIFMILLVLLFVITKLQTEIGHRGINMKFFPFVKKEVFWNEVKSAEVIDYGFVGGWGIRLWTKYGTVYNIRGSKGLAIELKSGKKFLIGSQKETELEQILEQVW